VNVDTQDYSALKGKIPVIVIGGMFLCVGTLTTIGVMIGTVNASLPPLVSFFGMCWGGLFGGAGYVFLTRTPYKTLWNDKGMNMLFLWKSETISWDQIEWYKIGVLIGSLGADVWIVLKYRQPIEGHVGCRTFVVLRRCWVPFEGFSSQNYTSVLDKYAPHKRIKKWRQVFQ
jgi:hypothetical protein